ncbi:hypothetical protein QFC21_003212 [Naganishia friedmannii]|uniref:Uncharacterized protein n=1 Tax=Naganishia friedmannii TaxID=89922 RepID=A0ACC2VRB5_9TREE|nr:hypothetical protein QFC21_003212 [Naganishia friedmannii]
MASGPTGARYISGLPVSADSATIPVTAAPTALSATSPTKPYTFSTPSPSASPSPSAAPSPVIREAVSLPRNDDDQVPKDFDNEHRVGSSKNLTADAPIDAGDNDFNTSSNQNTSNAHFVRTGSNSEPFAEQGFSGHGLRISGDSASRRSLLASLQVRAVVDVVIGPFYGYALDFGVTEVPVGWTPEEEACEAEEEGKTATEKQAELSSVIHGRRDVGSMYKAETAKAKAGREADEEKTRRMQQRLIDNDELGRKRQMDYAALVEQQKTQHEALMQSLQRDADEHETKRQRDADEREAKRQREHELAIAEAKKSAARSDRATAAALKTKEHYEHLACSLLVALSLLASYVAIRAFLFVGYGLFRWIKFLSRRAKQPMNGSLQPPDDGPPPSDAPAPPKDDDLPSEDDQTPLDNGPPPPDAPAPLKDDALSSDENQTPPDNSNQSDESATPSDDEANGLCGDSDVSGILDVSSGDGVNGSGDVVDGSGDGTGDSGNDDGSGDNTDGPGDDSNVSGDDSDGSGDEDADDSDPPSEDDVSGRAPPTAEQSVSSVTSAAPAIEQQASAAGTTPLSASSSSRSNDGDSLAAAQAPEIPAAPQQPGRSLDAVIEYIKAEREIVTREVEQKRLAEYVELYPNVFGNGNFVPPLRRNPDPTFGTSVVSGQAPGVTMFRKALTNSHRRLAVLGMGEGTDVAPSWANRSAVIQEMETNAAALSTRSVPATPVSTSASSTARAQLNQSAQPIVRNSVKSVGPQADGPQVKSNKSSQARSGVSYAAAASASLPVSHSNGPLPPSNDPLPPSNGPLPASESPVPPARQNSREVAKPPSEFNDTTLAEINTDAAIAALTSSSSFKSQRPASSGRALSCERLVQFDQIVNSDAVSESDNGEGVSGRVAPTLKNSVGAIFSSAPAVDQQASVPSTTSIEALGSRSNDTEKLAAALLSSSTSLANEEVPAAPQRPKCSVDAVLQGLDVGRWLATQKKEQKELTANVPLYVSGTLVPTLHRASSPTSTLRPAVTAAPGKLGDSARYGQSSGVALLERALDNSHRPPEVLEMREVNDVVPTSPHRSMYMQEGRAIVTAHVNRAAPATSVRLSSKSTAPAHLNRSISTSVRTSVKSVATGVNACPVNANRFSQAGSGVSSDTTASQSLPQTHNRGPVPPTRQNGQQAARLPGRTGDAKVPKVAADAPPRVHNPKYYFEDGGKKPH